MTTELMDLEEELPRRERRRLVTPVGIGAVAVVIAAAGFFGGVQVQKSRGDTGTGAGAAAGRFAGARAGGLGAGGAGAAGGAQGGAGGGAQGGAGGGAQGGAPGARGGGGQGGAGGATVGDVSSVDGKTLYVDDASGNTLRVRLAKGGKVTRTATSTASAIHPGDTVIVQGETASSGTVVASTIRATAANAAGGALGGFGGFGGGAPGAQSTPGGG
jgi:hypothetical protein